MSGPRKALRHRVAAPPHRAVAGLGLTSICGNAAKAPNNNADIFLQGRAGALRGSGSGRSAALPGPGSGRSSSPGSAATNRAPRGLVSGTAAGAKAAPPSRKPADDFRLRTGCLRWLLEKPRSAPGPASLLRARWLSILSMPPAPGSSCVGNCLLLQAHLVLEKTDPTQSLPVRA